MRKIHKTLWLDEDFVTQITNKYTDKYQITMEFKLFKFCDVVQGLFTLILCVNSRKQAYILNYNQLSNGNKKNAYFSSMSNYSITHVNMSVNSKV